MEHVLTCNRDGCEVQPGSLWSFNVALLMSIHNTIKNNLRDQPDLAAWLIAQQQFNQDFSNYSQCWECVCWLCMLFMSVLIKRLKANERNETSQATELQHHRAQDGLGLQICSQVALWCGSSTMDTQELWYYWMLIWIRVWWVWIVYEIGDRINLLSTKRSVSWFHSISQEFPQDKNAKQTKDILTQTEISQAKECRRTSSRPRAAESQNTLPKK